MDSNQTPSKRRRARKPDGKYQGDNPATPNLNEAWESTPIERVITEKSVDYSVKQQVTGPSSPTAGKYSKKDGIRPTFGKVTTTFN